MCVCVCVCVCVRALCSINAGLKAFNVVAALAMGGLGVSGCSINEGKGGLKSWTLYDGLSERVDT